MKKPYTLLVLFFLLVQLMNAQEIQFKKYTDKTHNFSFEIPEKWLITPEESKHSEIIAICKPNTKTEKEIYEDCYEGIVFRVYCYDNALDKNAELKDRFEEIKGTLFATIGKGNSKVDLIERVNYQIYYHNSICGITCKEMGYLSAAGECEHFYFITENQTIEIATNGRSLDKKVSDEIIKSFLFN